MRALPALLMLLPLLAQAEIYKFVDDRGNVTYTNMPRPGAKPSLVIPDAKPGGGPAPALGEKKSRPSGGKMATPSYFPKVDSGTQKKRDDMRRQLLLEELASEQRNLIAARNAHAQGARQPGADLAKLGDSVRLHEKNIEMLNKELSHIK